VKSVWGKRHYEIIFSGNPAYPISFIKLHNSEPSGSEEPNEMKHDEREMKEMKRGSMNMKG